MDIRPNYIPLPSPFNLTPPPAWFLADMRAFDSELVIFPSQAEAFYRLCRRDRGPLPALHVMSHPDAKICRLHRLRPVKAILPPPLVHWGPVILNDLAQYDLQRHGGGEQAARILDEREAAAERKLDKDIAEDAGHLAGEAYRAIKYHLGSAVSLGVRKPEGAGAYGHRERLILGPDARPARRPRPGRVYRPREAGDHAIFVGR
jgi:hypothetical protein